MSSFGELPVLGEDKCTGFPVGNFSISAEVPPNGDAFSRIMYNPPVLGPWLEEIGRGRFRFSCDGVSLDASEFESKQVHRLFPEAQVIYSDPKLNGLTVGANFFAPIKACDTLLPSIPALCADIELTNSESEEREVSVEFNLRFDVDPSSIRLLNQGSFWLVGNDGLKIGFDHPMQWHGIEDGISVSASMLLPPQDSAVLRFTLVCHDSRGFYADRCSDMASLTEYVALNWQKLRSEHDAFITIIPRTHDEQIDRYLRWYLQAAVLLTRVTREHVLTMGYCELNQRDSFWTSWPHLVLWPNLERRMLEESSEYQRPYGKIPTTILPIIEREDDIDINEYYNLRAARYYEWTHDLDFIRKLWPSLKRSIEYLKTRDRDGDGLLDQGSYWGDWKDVRGVQGRKSAPHFEFLWLAVLKYAVDYAGKLDDKPALEEYSKLYQRTWDVVHADVEAGGLWNGRFYTSQWYDGRTDDHVQEDQFPGPLYGVVPPDRVKNIYQSLGPNMTPWGVRDTYPYREQFSHAPGDYHNGGIWPFLNFADAMSRFTTGYLDGAYEILKRVGEWDLEKQGDFMPAEYLHGETGANSGKSIQAWNADYFAAVFFGTLGVEVISPNEVSIMPRIPAAECFETPILLPQGVIHIRQIPSQNSIQIEIESQLDLPVTLRYGVMARMVAHNSVSKIMGDCEFSVVELLVHKGETTTVHFTS
ncbi:hypothetical protein LLG39_04785 [bacterium]|nr:hypothetical protein [bacterium]